MALRTKQSQRAKRRNKTCVMGSIICYNQTPLIPSCSRNSWSHRNMVGILCTTTTTHQRLLLKYPLIRAPHDYESASSSHREREVILPRYYYWVKKQISFALLNKNWSTQNKDYYFYWFTLTKA